MGYRSEKLYGFPKGIICASTNPLLFPSDALLSGENVDLRNSGLATRKGYTQTSEVVPPVADMSSAEISVDFFSELDGRFYISAVYDATADGVWLAIPGDSDLEMWFYDCTANTIAQITVSGDVPPTMTGQAAVLHEGVVYIVGGWTSGTWASWKFDTATSVWTQLDPIPTGGTIIGGISAVLRSGVIWVFGGGTSASAGHRNSLYTYTIGTSTWAEVSASNCSNDPDCLIRHTAVDMGTAMLVWGGRSPTSQEQGVAWEMNWDTGAWSETAEIDQPGADLISPQMPRRGHAAVWVAGPDVMVRAAGAGYEIGAQNDVASYDPATHTWAVVSPSTGSDVIAQRENCGYCWDSTRERLLLFGGSASGTGLNFDVVKIDFDAGAGVVSKPVKFITQVRFPTLASKYIIAQMDDDTTSKLYVSDTDLPSTTATFTEIYDLGATAEVVSVAALNDRAVITEGVAQPPLVFLGCMQADGSDWAIPKQVLATTNGTDFYDMTSELCDPDAATTADIGSWPTAGYLYFCLDVPSTEGLYLGIGTANTTTAAITVERYSSGSWSGMGLTDNTAVTGKSLAQSGTVTWTAADTDYQEIAELAGFWIRVKWNAILSAGTTLTNVRFSAPCQPLQSIGSGTPDHPLCFIYHDVSEASEKDWTVEVSDEDYLSSARLSTKGTGGETVVPMGSSDAIYIAGLTRFNAIMLQPGKDNNNSETAALSVQYWNGTAWTTVSGLNDGTSASSKTLRQKGKISWTLPTSWRQSRGLNRNYPMGYWVRLTVNASLSTRVYIEECGLYPVQEDLKKHRFAITLRDRVCLAGRTDAPDQIDISRALEEYGWTGEDSYSLRVGGQGGLNCAVTAYNQAWLGKADEIYMLNGYSPTTFASERAETGGQSPINNRVIVPGPVAESDAKVKQGWFFLNLMGAYHFTGLQTYSLSSYLSWWDETSTNLPRIDLNYLHTACGVYWPERSWIVWAVPMITADGQTSQTSNNRIIVYDLTLGAWLPPFTIAAASLCVARHHNSSAPDSLGQRGLYMGGYDGKVYRLLDGDSDAGVAISCNARTGHLHFDMPDWEKAIHSIRAFGKLDDAPVILDCYVDGEATVRDGNSVTFSAMTGIGSKVFSREYVPKGGIQGTTFQLELTWSGPGEIYGLEMKVPEIRERPRT